MFIVFHPASSGCLKCGDYHVGADIIFSFFRTTSGDHPGEVPIQNNLMPRIRIYNKISFRNDYLYFLISFDYSLSSSSEFLTSLATEGGDGEGQHRGFYVYSKFDRTTRTGARASSNMRALHRTSQAERILQAKRSGARAMQRAGAVRRSESQRRRNAEAQVRCSAPAK